MTVGEAQLFQLVVCWLFLVTGKCEPVLVSRPITLDLCERTEIKVRARRAKLIHAYCL